MKKLAMLLAVLMLLTACSSNTGGDSAAAPELSAGEAETVDTDETGDAAGEKIMIQHVVSLENPWHIGSEKMAEVLATGGFNAEVYGNGVLCQNDWKLMFEQTQSGSNDIAIESATSLTSIIPEVFAINLPFVFQDQDHLDRWLQSDSQIIRQWNELFAEKNLVILAMSSKPFRQLINNQRMIKTPEDIRGLKFRVPDTPTFVKVFESMGAKPVALAGSEIYSAIQLGTVVGQDNSVPNVYDFKTHEVAKYMTIWNYMGDASIVVMNKDKFDALTPQQQELFLEAGQAFNEVNLTEDKSYYDYAWAEMEKAGTEFYVMSPEEKEPFAQLMEPVYSDFAGSIGQDNWEILMAEIDALR